MKITSEELSALPDVLSKEQLYKLCHISKRTAQYLLTSGLIPCENTGKKTRCYSIRKEDVVNYIIDREQNPSKYMTPNQWFGHRKNKDDIPLNLFDGNVIMQSDLQDFYTSRLESYPDLLKTDDICKITGYKRTAVYVWIKNGQLKALTKTNGYFVPKEYLILFLCSGYYNHIKRKTQKHFDAICEMIWKMGR